MTSDDDDLILSIYNTVADNTLWPEVLDRISERAGARGSVVFHFGESDRVQSLYASSFHIPRLLNTYLRRFSDGVALEQSAFLTHGSSQDKMEVIIDDVLYKDIGEYRRRPHIRAAKSIGIMHHATSVLNKDNPYLGQLSLQLDYRRGPMTLEESDNVRMLLGHVAKALDLGHSARQLLDRQSQLFAAMDRLALGMCLINQEGQVVLENTEFQRQLDTYNVFEKKPGGRLVFRHGREQQALEWLGQNPLLHGRFGARPRKEAISTHSGSTLCVEAVPISRSDELSSKSFGGMMLYSTDTSRPFQCDVKPLQRVFELTDAEAALAQLIADGLTNVQIAERRQRSVATVNAQVKSILTKTGCATRTQFCRLFLSFGANLLLDP